jgi:hypothetical protein
MEGPFPEVDYLVLGHVTQDLTPDGPRPGGTVTFASLTAQALGLHPGIVTAAAGGALPAPLAHLPAHTVASAASTTFRNEYAGSRRTQFVLSVADPLGLDDVPACWRRAPIVHLAPLARELDASLAGQFPDSFVGLTPQGWLRQWDTGGRVSAAPWPDAEPALRAASAVVISREDVQGDEEVIRLWAGWARVLVVTAGPEGATVYAGGEARHFAAPRAAEIDPTGAGDIFAAVYFALLRAEGDSFAAAGPAVALASSSVEYAGLAGIPSPEAVRAALPGWRLK